MLHILAHTLLSVFYSSCSYGFGFETISYCGFNVAVDSLCGEGFVHFFCLFLYWAVVLFLFVCRILYIRWMQVPHLIYVLPYFPSVGYLHTLLVAAFSEQKFFLNLSVSRFINSFPLWLVQSVSCLRSFCQPESPEDALLYLEALLYLSHLGQCFI